MVLFQIQAYVINILYSPNGENFKPCSFYISVADNHSRYFNKTLGMLKLAIRYQVTSKYNIYHTSFNFVAN